MFGFQPFKLPMEIISYLVDMIQQSIQHPQKLDRDCASQRSSTERCSVHARGACCSPHDRGENRTQRQPRGKRLCNGHDVRS